MSAKGSHLFAEFIRPHRGRIAAVAAGTAFVAILAMSPPLLVRAVIDRVIADGQTSILPGLIVFMFLVPVVHAVSAFLQVIGMAYIGQKFVMDLRYHVYAHYLRLSMRFHSKHSVGKRVNRLMDDSSTLQGILSVASVQIVADLVSAVFAISVSFLLNWRLALLLFVIVVLFVVNYRANIGGIRRATRTYRGADDRLAGGVQNRLSRDLTVKSYGAEMREHAAFSGHSDASLQMVARSKQANTTFSMNTALLRDLGRAAIYFLGCALVLQDTASYGDVLTFTAYAMQLLMPAVRFSEIANQVQNVRVSIDRLRQFLDEEPEVTSYPGSVKVQRVKGNIDFDNVGFGYEKHTPVLQQLDFKALQGETVALIGPTGCGKTTILSLLLRFYDVQKGAIRIDGIDLRDFDLTTLRRQFGIVLQEPFLFDTSIADNIRYGRPGATLEEVQAAARMAVIHDDVMALSNGYDSVPGTGDVVLSVGQKQRISIARAILADPVILIMDEATSALDSESERAIQTALNTFLHGRTSFIVAHRLSTIRHADRIILLEGGHIRETGTHERLMEIADGAYRDLYNKHVGKGVLTDE